MRSRVATCGKKDRLNLCGTSDPEKNLAEEKSETMKTPLEHGRLLKAPPSPKLTAVIPERRVFVERVLT